MTKANDPSDNELTGDTSYEHLMDLLHELVSVWADQIKDMSLHMAQQFISAQADKMLAEMTDACGPSFAGLLVTIVERAVWQRYDRHHMRISVA